MTRKLLLAIAATAAAVATVGLPGALGAAGASTPGVTSRTITVGGTFPLSGPASGYAPIPYGMKAYFSYVNATKGPDGKRGVGGRQIVFKFYDDAYNPAQTVQLTRKLVEQDHVFAILGSLGTEPNLAIRPYLNQMKVPQLFVSTGDSFWGTQYKQYPWTIGWQPNYVAEGYIYARFIVSKVPQAKIAVLYQNDSYGKDYLNGLKQGLGTQASKIVAEQAYEVTAPDVSSQMAQLKASGANVLFVFATPKFAIQSVVIAAKLGWHPQFFMNSVSGTNTFMGLAAASSSPAAVNGMISADYLRVPDDPAFANDPGIKFYRQIMAKYYPSGNANDVLYVYGMGIAATFVDALRQAGPNPTRDAIMKAVDSLNVKDNPFVLKGITIKTGPTDHFPIEQAMLDRWQNGHFVTFGHLLTYKR